MKEKFLTFWHNFIQAPLLIALLVTAVPFTIYMVQTQAKSPVESGEEVNTADGIAGAGTDAVDHSGSGSASENGSESGTGSFSNEDGPSEGEGSGEREEQKNTAWETIPAEEAQETSTEAATIDPALQVIPDGVNSPVMQAADYGNVNTAYRAPAGTVFEHDRSGIFAPDGTYYYLQSVPDDSYFSDALFIGDSRMAGFAGYSSLKNVGNFWAKESMTVFNIYDDSITLVSQGVSDADGAKSLDEVLDGKQYGKIYVSMGINEIGMPYTTTFIDRYRKILTDIREKQPEAIIYITGIMHVSQAISSTDSVTNNPNIVERNEALVSLTNGRDIFYLDMDPAVCDDNGDLIADLTGDGIHLKASAYEKWADFLRQNAIVKDNAESGNAESSPAGSSSEASSLEGTETSSGIAETTETSDAGAADGR